MKPASLYERERLGVTIANEMIRRALSYRRMAAESEVSGATVHRVVHGEKPDIETYLRLKFWLASSHRRVA